MQLDADAVDLRLVDSKGDAVHARRFLNDTTSNNPVPFHVLRKADGTAFFLLPPGFPSAGFLPGTYRLTMDFRRDNTGADAESLILSAAGQTAPETAILEVPSSTVHPAGRVFQNRSLGPDESKSGTRVCARICARLSMFLLAIRNTPLFHKIAISSS